MNKQLQFGVGTDIESVDRFNCDEGKNQGYLNKIFTKKELKYCFGKKRPAEHLAVRFAAKEAAIKAFSSMEIHNLIYSDIEVQNHPNGQPYIVILAKINKKILIKASLSHCQDKALAFVLIFQGD